MGASSHVRMKLSGRPTVSPDFLRSRSGRSRTGVFEAESGLVHKAEEVDMPRKRLLSAPERILLDSTLMLITTLSPCFRRLVTKYQNQLGPSACTEELG
jgi:hypothetical protein